MNIGKIIDGLCLISSVTPNYTQGRRDGFADDETEKIAYDAVGKAINKLEELKERDRPFIPTNKKELENGELEGNCKCGSLITYYENYCFDCGQAINWER